MRALADLRGFRDDRGGMDAGRELGRGMEQLDGAREIEVGIGGAQRGHAHRAGVRRDEDRGGVGGLDGGTVLAIREEGEIARFGVLDSGDASDFDVGVALERAAKFFGDVSKLH